MTDKLENQSLGLINVYSIVTYNAQSVTLNLMLVEVESNNRSSSWEKVPEDPPSHN